MRKVLRHAILLLACLFFIVKLHAATIKGSVVDEKHGAGVTATTVLVVSLKDSTQRYAVMPESDGTFTINNLTPQSYRLTISSPGYKRIRQTVRLGDEDKDLGVIKIQAEEAVELEAVKVSAFAVRATQRGDTVEFNADAYKVNQDATTEDLLKKLPGVTVEGGVVKTQGEDVKKVLVDGKPFFGDDPTVAIRNLPAEVIAKIEVFDKQSEQSQLTGFDDGNSEKTINIVTRENKRMGQFGRAYAGVGYDDVQKEMRYTVGGNLNFFNKQRRISIVGMSNNVNQQNFASEDLVSSGGGGRRGGRSFSSSPDGIATTTALGINYSDMWGKNMEVTGSYFFNMTDKETENNVTRQYFVSADSVQWYRQHSGSSSTNYNHRLNFKFDYKFNDNNSLTYTPSLSFQTNNSNSNTWSNMEGLSSANSNSDNNSRAFNFSNELIFRHKFEKVGRTFSANVRANVSDSKNENELVSRTWKRATLVEARNQQSANPTNNWSARSSLAYTEPIGKFSMLQLNYDLNYSYGESNKETFNIDTVTNTIVGLDSLYSNIYNNNYWTHRAGLSYRIKTEKFSGTVGLNGEKAILDGNRIMPKGTSVDKSFNSLLPNAQLEYKFSKQQSLRASYWTSTNAPSIAQLQDVIDNNNPLLLKTGNPDLDQSYSQRWSIRYNQTTLSSGTTFFAMAFASNTMNNVTSYSITANKDTVLHPHNSADSIVLLRGSQFSMPVNVDGYWQARGVLTFGFPIAIIKSNLNLTTTGSYSRQPGFVNGAKNISDNYGLSQGIVLGSNISENIDFTVSYNASYNITKNTLQTSSNDTYFQHSASFKTNIIFWKGITFEGVANYTQYKGLANGYNQEYLRLDASLGKKFLKDNRGELKFTVYDILNQNKSFNRNVTESYIEDVSSKVLSRYFMLTFTYTLRSFGTPTQRRESDEGDGFERRRYRDGGGGGSRGGYGGGGGFGGM